MESLGDFWQVAHSTGGGVALAFIVALTLGIGAMMVVYLVSAVVVLDRFARVAHGLGARLVAGVAVALVIALLANRALHPELVEAPFADWALAAARAFAVSAGLTAFAMGLVKFVTDRFDPSRVHRSVARTGVLGVALTAAGTGIALIPAVVMLPAVLTGLAWWVRGRRAPDARSAIGALDAFGAVPLFAVATLAVGLPAPIVAALGRTGDALLAAVAAVVLCGLLPHAAAGFCAMRGSAEWFIAARYLVAKRRQVFISAITGICVVGIAAGVWLIIVVLSVMNGFEQTWRDEILGDRAHFVVLPVEGAIRDWPDVLERTRRVPGVVAASPYLDVDAMVRGRGGEVHSVRLRGIDPEAIGGVTRLRDDLVAGSLDDLVAGPTRDEAESDEAGQASPGVVIGNQLSSALSLGLGDELLVISPFGGPPTPLGPSPRVSRFEVVGIFPSSFYQYDEVYAYVSIATAQDFRRSGPVIDGIEAVTTDYYRSQQVGAAVVAALGDSFEARDWKEYFPAFFQALKTERVMMGVLLTMIMVVAAFIIVATLVMMIMEKSSDIAILKAMGAEDAMIERIFALEGTLIGLLGTALGVLAGLAVTHRLGWIQDRIEGVTGVDTLPSAVYQLSSLPSRVDPLQIAVVVMLAMVLSLGATLLPSRQGARIDPAEGLRHE